jgi:hypothetical protein
MLGSNDKTPLAAIALRQTAFALGGSKTSCESSGRQHLAMRRRGPQQPIVKKVRVGNNVKYQSVNRGVEAAANLAAFAGACPPLIAALRGALSSRQIRPGDAETQFGNRISCCRMKEYDA